MSFQDVAYVVAKGAIALVFVLSVISGLFAMFYSQTKRAMASDDESSWKGPALGVIFFVIALLALAAFLL